MSRGPMDILAQRALIVFGVSILLVGALPAPLGGLALLVSKAAFWLIFAPFIYTWLRGRSDAEDRGLLALELAELLESGQPLGEALALLSQDKARRFEYRWARTTPALDRISQAVAGGASLSGAVGKEKAFPPVWAGLLKAGEETQKLEMTLRAIAELEQTSPQLSAVTWVRLVVVAPVLLGCWSFLVTYILPTFVQLFEGMGLQLPTLTRWVIGLAVFGRSPAGNLLVLIGVLLCWGIPVSADLRRWLWLLMLKLPAWRALRLEEQARICQVMAAGVASGLPLDELRDLGQTVVEHRSYKAALASETSAGGDSLSQMMERNPRLFEPSVIWLVKQGEQFDSLEEALFVAAAHLRKEAELAIQKTVVTLDTAVLAVMGLATAAVLAGVMLPLTKLNATLAGVYLP